MENELKNEIYEEEEGIRHKKLNVVLYIDDEDQLRKEVEDIVSAYNDYTYVDDDDMERDCIDTVKRHLKWKLQAYNNEDPVDN